MIRLIWSPAALGDIERLYAFLEDKNPSAARRAIAVIRAAANLLQQQPRAGRTHDYLPEAFREWPVAFGQSGYVVFYHFDEVEIVILAVKHMREAGY